MTVPRIHAAVVVLIVAGLASTSAMAHDPKGLLTQSKLQLKSVPMEVSEALAVATQQDSFARLRSLLRRQSLGQESNSDIASSLGLSVDNAGTNLEQIAQAYGSRTARWSPGKTLHICFFDGQQDAWTNVADVFNGVLAYTSLKLVSNGSCDKGSGDIRVSFETGSGYWSLVGIAANRYAKSEPTLGLDGLGHAGAFSEDERGTATHELLHSIGWEHEQQRPDVKCQYKSDAEIGQLLGWDDATVKANFHPITVPSPILSKTVDKGSPMYYQLTQEFFVDGDKDSCYQPERNNILTQIDKDTLKAMYP